MADRQQAAGGGARPSQLFAFEVKGLRVEVHEAAEPADEPVVVDGEPMYGDQPGESRPTAADIDELIAAGKATSWATFPDSFTVSRGPGRVCESCSTRPTNLQESMADVNPPKFEEAPKPAPRLTWKPAKFGRFESGCGRFVIFPAFDSHYRNIPGRFKACDKLVSKFPSLITDGVSQYSHEDTLDGVKEWCSERSRCAVAQGADGTVLLVREGEAPSF